MASDDEMEALRQSMLAELEELETTWSAPSGSIDAKLQALFGYSTDTFEPARALEQYDSAVVRALNVSMWCDGSGEEGVDARVSTVIGAINEAYSTLISACWWSGQRELLPVSSRDQALRYAPPPAVKESPMIAVIRFYLSWTARMHLRHRDDIVYQQIIVDGMPTRAWVPAVDYEGMDLSDMEKLFTFIVSKRKNVELWVTSLNVSSKMVVDRLRASNEIEFPQVQTSRYYMSFSDGIYSILNDQFIPYADLSEHHISSDIASCAFHDVAFAPAFIGRKLRPGERMPRAAPLHPLVDIATPSLDIIFNTQQLCGHTRVWLMAMLGRLLYDAAVLEEWQVALYIKGRAGTGKSTLLSLVASFFSPGDVSLIGNDVAEGFGLETLLRGSIKAWLAPEVKGDFKLDQASFQSLVSNEPQSIQRKHKTAIERPVMIHGAMAGNLLPANWLDNAGSINRRIFVVEFAHAVTDTKTDILGKLKREELPFVLRKFNHCYRIMTMLVGAKNIWQCGRLSGHIIRQHQIIFSGMNSLNRFLQEGGIDRDDSYWVPEETLADEFRKFRNLRALNPFVWNEDNIGTILRDFGLTRRLAAWKWGETAGSGIAIVGCCPHGMLNQMAKVADGDNPIFHEGEVAASVTDEYAL